MSPGLRRGAVLAGGAVLLGLLCWGIAGLPGFGAHPAPLGDAVARAGVPERGATDIVTTVNVDFRGFDTIGEELILFCAATAVVVLLRRERTEVEHAPRDDDAGRDDALTAAGSLVCVLALLFGLYLVAHGQLTPGGGFQGGVAMASGLLVLYLSVGYTRFARLLPVGLLEGGEGAGAAGFVAIGLASMVAGAAFLQNLLPRGEVGSIDSGGTIGPIYAMVGLAVGSGFALILLEFLTQEEAISPQGDDR